LLFYVIFKIILKQSKKNFLRKIKEIGDKESQNRQKNV
jgi:hypothetical protein